jgi:hypothetical protein
MKSVGENTEEGIFDRKNNNNKKDAEASTFMFFT